MAKAMVDLADTNYCHAVWHLSHLHLSSSVYCAIFRSHFSELHPMYQIMRYHCEGTTPHVALDWPSLASPGKVAHRSSSMGYRGFIQLAEGARERYYYGKLAFDNLMEVSIV